MSRIQKTKRSALSIKGVAEGFLDEKYDEAILGATSNGYMKYAVPLYSWSLILKLMEDTPKDQKIKDIKILTKAPGVHIMVKPSSQSLWRIIYAGKLVCWEGLEEAIIGLCRSESRIKALVYSVPLIRQIYENGVDCSSLKERKYDYINGMIRQAEEANLGSITPLLLYPL